MGLTSFFSRQTPHFTSVAVIGTLAFIGPFGGTFGVECKALAKDKTITNPWLELAGALGVSVAAGATGVIIMMNPSWAKHQAAKEEDRKILIETRLEARHANGGPTEADGGNLKK